MPERRRVRDSCGRTYEEFIAAFTVHQVRYQLIGAHAVAYHARPRATRDLDILIDPPPVNTRRVLAALRTFFGGADLGYSATDLAIALSGGAR